MKLYDLVKIRRVSIVSCGCSPQNFHRFGHPSTYEKPHSALKDV
jgi:hypothetical protein